MRRTGGSPFTPGPIGTTIQDAGSELLRIPLLRRWVNRVCLSGSGLLVEDILDLRE